MKYTSTRDATKFYTFEEALFSGYAPDGGLFVPVELPSFFQYPDIVLGEEWPKLGYCELATEILHPFIGDEGISKSQLKVLLSKALAGFDVPDENQVPVVPLTKTYDDVGDENSVDCYVAELFHGPTQCFKDLGMRATIFLMNHFTSKMEHPRKVVLTAATTGDTGPAAVQAVQDLDSSNLGIVVHYPDGQISDFQRKQMTTVSSDRVEIVSFEGGGDDMDRPIKNIMMQKDNTDVGDEKVLVCGVNSYNIGRPLMQMVHFVWTYLRVVEHIEQKTNQKIDHNTFRLDIVIPTGAMGNIAGCYMAKKFGIPFGNICAGVNTNDITHRAFSTGIVQKPKSGEPMKQSLSDAINIQLPYNLERLLFYLTDENHTLINAWYNRLETTDAQEGSGIIDLTTPKDEEDSSSATWLNRLQSEFRSARIDDDLLCETMQNVLKSYGYFTDPHTGVAFAAAQQLGYFSESSDPVAIMATASPCKFETAMTVAVGQEKWNEYEEHYFPARGKDLKDKDEIPPTLYKADPMKTLEENQKVWEANTRALIVKVGG